MKHLFVKRIKQGICLSKAAAGTKSNPHTESHLLFIIRSQIKYTLKITTHGFKMKSLKPTWGKY